MHDPRRRIWEHWSQRLKAMEMGHFAAMLLEATGPLNLAGAQLVYLGQPLFSGLLPAERIEALAALLEDDTALRSFIAGLREVDA